MRKFISAILCSLLLPTGVLMARTVSEDYIPIIIVYEPAETPIYRAPAATQPIQAVYSESLRSVLVNSAISSGDTDVVILNLTTGEEEDYTLTGPGISVLPVSGDAGSWSIRFTLPDGTVLTGSFTL